MLNAKKIAADKHKDPLIAIIVSVIICSVLVVYPLNYTLAGWRPLIMLMVTLFWILCQPSWCGVWFAFGIGLFTDLLLDAPLGLNALSYVLITFIVRYFIRERRVMTFANTWIIVSMSVVAHLVFILLAQVISDVQSSITRHWLPLMSSIGLWPVLYYCLKRWRV